MRKQYRFIPPWIKITIKQDLSGFSLIEVMLLLAIMASVLMVGMCNYEIEVRNFKVDKTALQLQQWLEAAMAYYVDHQQWPQGTEQQPLRTLISTGYLPAASGTTDTPIHNPWGNDYAAQSVISASNPNGYFEVSTNIPVTVPHYQQIATAIAARMPFASHPAQTGAVITQVTIPGQASNIASNIPIKWIGYLDSDHPQLPANIDLTCPNGAHAQVAVAFNGFYNNHQKWDREHGIPPIYSINFNNNLPESQLHDATQLQGPLLDISYAYAANGKAITRLANSTTGTVLAIVACPRKKHMSAIVNNRHRHAPVFY